MELQIYQNYSSLLLDISFRHEQIQESSPNLRGIQFIFIRSHRVARYQKQTEAKE